MKKFICTVCGYVHEGDEAPEICPQCKQPKSKFKELVETEGALTFVDEHRLGVAKGVDPEVLEGLRAHFNGECSEVGMYLAMSRQADREGFRRLQRLSNAMLLKRQSMRLNLQNYWENVFGIPKQT